MSRSYLKPRGFGLTALLVPVLLALGCLLAVAKPNILVLLADDMGFSDPSCYGGEIQTPNLDRLAKGGLRFTQFYNTSRCWPSRAALLTGYYAQQVRRDTVPGVVSGASGVRPPWAKLLPEMLKSYGYRAYHSGKWHLDGKPWQNGFDHSYVVWDTDRHFGPHQHERDDRPLPPVSAQSGYYSSTAIADQAIQFLQEHAAHYAKQPFFAYVAFIAPHFPLQAPATDVARYQDTYLRGWEILRNERWVRMQRLGMGGSALSRVERDIGPPYDFPKELRKLGPNEVNRPLAWETLNPGQQKFQSGKMAVHAAMVDRMDQEIGRLLNQIRIMRAMDDTLILFLSDNGASAEIMVRGDGHDPNGALGSAATFLSLGPGWSTVANTPFRRHKTWVHEGGISTPLIVHWPNGIAARGQLRQTPGHLIDLVPTILEAAGAKQPLRWGDGQPVPKPPGKSLLPVFRRDGTVTHESFWWQHEANRALRVGDWKIVAAGNDSAWELYNLNTDRSETLNLAQRHPEKVRELAREWTRQMEVYRAQACQDWPVLAGKRSPADPPD